MAEKKKDYEVGYGRPPKHSRFKKGQSGNPRGRPKGAKSVDTILHQILTKPVTVTEGGRRRTVTSLEAFLLRLMRAALEGEGKSTDHFLRLMPLIERALSPETADGEGGMAARSLFAGPDDLEILRHFAEDLASGVLSLDEEDPS